ncbi:MAG: phosphate ABC transporter permease subunit PstC [Candidatus Jordarchaeales archaeon]|nr:phosphate ABC transporter permease subunit PstC [Candidatus Jordarchaeia archaeon]
MRVRPVQFNIFLFKRAKTKGLLTMSIKIKIKVLDYVKRFFSPEGLSALCALSSLAITGLIFVFLFLEAAPAFKKLSYGFWTVHLAWLFGYGNLFESNIWLFLDGNIFAGLWNFITGTTWSPNAYLFGILPVIQSTLIVVGGAVLVATPIGILSAVHLAEYCSLKLKTTLKYVIELLASIPSVVYGLVGLTIVVPWIKNAFNLSSGNTALAGIIILSVMILPTIVSVSEDAISSIPKELSEASYALGAKKFQTVFKVVLPAAATGVAASIILAVARALGETMAVLMLTGNTPFLLDIPPEFIFYGGLEKVSLYLKEIFLSPVYLMTSAIALEVGESSWNSMHYQSLLGIGFVLFVMT